MAVNNRYISNLLRLGGQILELHGENVFKTRSYDNAASAVRTFPKPLATMDEAELEEIPGIGKNIAKKIAQISETGSYEELDKLMQQTPPGLLELLKIKGLGVKKIQTLWQDGGITSPEELMEAAEAGQVAGLRGMGKKTEDKIKELVEFYFQSKDKFLYSEAELDALPLLAFLEGEEGVHQVSFTGDMRRKMPVIEKIDILVDVGRHKLETILEDSTEVLNITKEGYSTCEMEIPVFFHKTTAAKWAADLMRTTGNEEHLANLKHPDKGETEEEIYKANGFPYIIPEMREGLEEFELIKGLNPDDIVDMKHIRGCLHNHSTYSDGVGTVEQMARYCMEQGWEYFGISDHSQTAVYARGLKPKQVLAQIKEVDALNKDLAPFRVFKGIESDILGNGSLDYEEDILKRFDYIVASVHSGMKMTEGEANKRLITAIENPYTTMLGHMTTRLLLMRQGFPVDHKKIIDSCAANGVVIEINANPRRLDMDWSWIPYAVKKDVMLSINPDAHDMGEVHNMYYGICVARKAGLTYDMVLNCKPLHEVEAFFERKKASRP